MVTPAQPLSPARKDDEWTEHIDDLWDEMWEQLRHEATGRPSGRAIIAKWRPVIESAVIAATPPAAVPDRLEGLRVKEGDPAARMPYFDPATLIAGTAPETTPAGVLDEAALAAEKALPEGWVLDGYRRLYDEGHAAERWVARAVEPMRDDEKPDDWFLPLRVGEGPTPAAALLALAAALGRSGSGGGRG